MTAGLPQEVRRPHRGVVVSLTILVVAAFAVAAPAQSPQGPEGPAGSAEPSIEVQEQQVQEQQARERYERELAELRAELAALRAQQAAAAGAAAPQPDAEGSADERLAELERRIDALAAELERLQLGGAAPTAAATPAGRRHGLAPAASKVYAAAPGVSLGGYGEMLYEGPDARRDDGSPSGRTAQLDLLRAVLYFGYKFDRRFVFNSEIEFEHATTDEGRGEAAVEFAYLDYLWRPEVSFRAGLLLVPMGLVNELHEPTTFLGARRPDVERFILPTTWRENGFGVFGDVGPVSYRSYLVTGFEADELDAEEGLREARQEGSKAVAEDFAWVGRLDWTATPGLLVGGSAWLGDSGQDLTGADGRPIAVGTRILEGHLDWRWRGLELRALAARAELDDVAALDRALGLSGAESIGETLEGFYLQAGYDLLAGRRGEPALVPYVRWESYDTQAAVPRGFARDPANDVDSLTLGVAFRPIDRIVIKADWQDYDNAAGDGTDQINVALGYIF